MSAPERTPVRVRHCGPYVLGRRIGAGGMAAVFAARQAGPGGAQRVVALKVMSTAMSGSRELEQMFLREASIAARLEHPNIVRTYEVGQGRDGDGDLYLVMELLFGATLSALQASEAPMPLGIAVRVVADIARGLHAAHELCGPSGERMEVVHQDVSPHNVMVGYDGSTKLLDFGVARLGTVDASRTENVRGKPSYLAPEQVSLGKLDRRVDVFALGIVLYELLAGRRLFRRESAAKSLEAVLEDEVPSVRAARPDVPAELAAVASRALKWEPAERFATADAMRVALLAAAGAANVAVAADEEVGRWALSAAPPPFTRVELERELMGSAASPGAEAAVDVTDLPTVAPVRGASRRKRARRLAAVAVVALAAGGVAAGVVIASRSARTADVPGGTSAARAIDDPSSTRATGGGAIEGATEEAPAPSKSAATTEAELAPVRATTTATAAETEPARKVTPMTAPRASVRAAASSAAPPPPPARPRPSGYDPLGHQ